MQDKTKIFLDLSNLSEAERKEAIALLPQEVFDNQYKIDSIDYHLQFSGSNWWVINLNIKYKQEVNFQQFKEIIAGENLQVDSEITFLNRYSDTNLPDNMGRWARKVLYKHLCIGWINRLENEGKVMFSLSTFFPLTGNDSPTKNEICETFEDSKNRIENLWNEFMEKLTN